MREAKKAAFPEILKKNKGMIALTSQELDMDRSTYYYWREHDAEFAKKCDEVLECAADNVEFKLLTKIDQGDTASIIFYCKTKLKHRGYVERLEQRDVTPVIKLDEQDEAIVKRAIQREFKRSSDVEPADTTESVH